MDLSNMKSWKPILIAIAIMQCRPTSAIASPLVRDDDFMRDRLLQVPAITIRGKISQRGTFQDHLGIVPDGQFDCSAINVAAVRASEGTNLAIQIPEERQAQTFTHHFTIRNDGPQSCEYVIGLDRSAIGQPIALVVTQHHSKLQPSQMLKVISLGWHNPLSLFWGEQVIGKDFLVAQ
jgi:hypothetical protein